VPLSEREQRILEEIERNLHQEDPALGRAGRRGPHLDRVRRIKLGGVMLAAGFLLLFAFFVSGSVTFGVLAFVAMVGGIVLVAGSMRETPTDRASIHLDRRDRLIGALRAWEERVRKRRRGS
jgi:Protein of unknown function (DUF3040)